MLTVTILKSPFYWSNSNFRHISGENLLRRRRRKGCISSSAACRFPWRRFKRRCFFFRGSIDPLINPKRWDTFIVKPETRCRKEHDLHLFLHFLKNWIVLKPASFLGCLNHFVDSRSGIDYFLMGLHGMISSDIYFTQIRIFLFFIIRIFLFFTQSGFTVKGYHVNTQQTMRNSWL